MRVTITAQNENEDEPLVEDVYQFKTREDAIAFCEFISDIAAESGEVTASWREAT
jgi:hypothetical protein